MSTKLFVCLGREAAATRGTRWPRPLSTLTAIGARAGAALGLLALLLLATIPGASLADSLTAYRLSAGDKVRIAVFGEDDLTVSERVSDRGTVSYPLLGELKVEGMTPGEVEMLVASRLRGPYLVDPRVRVSIEEYREFFVMGQVNRPGGYAFLPGLTVRKAISLAGGYTERASRRKLFVVSEDRPNQERQVEQDYKIAPGDTVVVKESFF